MKGIRLTNKASRSGIGYLRLEILQRDNYKCQYCGASAPNVELEVDHIIPIAKGGVTADYNLITACKTCNQAKGKMLLKNAPVIKQITNLKTQEGQRKHKTTILFELFDEIIKYKKISRTAQAKKLLQDCLDRYGFETVKKAILKTRNLVKIDEKIERLNYKSAIEAFKKIPYLCNFFVLPKINSVKVPSMNKMLDLYRSNYEKKI